MPELTAAESQPHYRDPIVVGWIARTQRVMRELGVNTNRALRITDHAVEVVLTELARVDVVPAQVCASDPMPAFLVVSESCESATLWALTRDDACRHYRLTRPEADAVVALPMRGGWLS